jgi:hypothetical protein
LCGRLGKRHAPRARHDLVDRDGERLPRQRAADLDRAGERVARVELGIARLELLAGVEVPTGVRHRDAHRVARIDDEHRLEAAREVAVQRAPLERQDMRRHQPTRSRKPW